MARLLLTDNSTFTANLDYDSVNDIYTINNLPIPPTFLLLGAGLLGRWWVSAVGEELERSGQCLFRF